VGDIARDEVAQLIALEQGIVYSRQDLIASQTAIEELLADRGYAFSNVNGVPEQRRDAAIVNFIFIVDPGPTVYIRRINIIGNESTRDEVIRRELRQLEGAVYSLSKIRRSRERLAKLGFFRDVSIQTPRVSGVIDQVDMLVEVEERSTGNFNFGVGYSGSEKLLLQAEITRENLFGTGRELRFKVDHSALTKIYDVAYRNPYYTTHGVSREVFVGQREVDATEVDSADYHEDTTSGGVRYRIPLTEYDSMALSAAVEDITLASTVDTPIEFGDFIDNYSQSTTLLLSGSLVRDTRDNRQFPSKGFWNRATAEISFPGSDLEFYTVSARSVWYRPIGKNLTLGLNGQLGYGAGYGDLDTLPFYKNFHAGGARSLRGYKARSLGPHSIGTGKQSLGGSKRVVFGGELKFPVPGLEDSRDKRLALFVDGGQVYSQTESIDVSTFRFSTGLAFEWMSAIGPIAFSYAIPFNDSSGDNVEHFQFTLGGLFR
jgi:outer membrane protein insertion porin family